MSQRTNGGKDKPFVYKVYGRNLMSLEIERERKGDFLNQLSHYCLNQTRMTID